MVEKSNEKVATDLFNAVEEKRKYLGSSMRETAARIGVSRHTIHSLGRGLATEKTIPRVVAWLRAYPSLKAVKEAANEKRT